eukprot:COSAG06_NODE_15068_length_1100_cov_1.087912_2_plen_44_part_01
MTISFHLRAEPVAPNNVQQHLQVASPIPPCLTALKAARPAPPRA